MLVLGLILGVVGVFGLVWMTFLISRHLTSAYGHADATLVHRATKDRTVPTALRWGLRGAAALAAAGAFLVVSRLFA